MAESSVRASGERLGCLLSAPGYGQRWVPVTRIDHGIGIVASKGQARHHEALYTQIVTSSSFEMQLVFSSYEKRTEFCEWAKTYLLRISNPSNTTVGPMDISVPARRFRKTGIPAGDFTFGDDILAVTYPLSLSFTGTSDPMDLADQDLYSTYELPDLDPEESVFFHPGGIQLSGATGQDALIRPWAH